MPTLPASLVRRVVRSLEPSDPGLSSTVAAYLRRKVRKPSQNGRTLAEDRAGRKASRGERWARICREVDARAGTHRTVAEWKAALSGEESA